MVQIQGYKVNKLHMENTVANGTELQLQNQVKYNVNYMDDVHQVRGDPVLSHYRREYEPL